MFVRSGKVSARCAIIMSKKYSTSYDIFVGKRLSEKSRAHKELQVYRYSKQL